MKRLFVILLALLVTLPFAAFAHGGRTDSNGAHRDGDDYHYHHGFPAHYHHNGKCEYENQTPVHESHANTSNNNKKANLEFDNKETSTGTHKVASEPKIKNPPIKILIFLFVLGYLYISNKIKSRKNCTDNKCFLDLIADFLTFKNLSETEYVTILIPAIASIITFVQGLFDFHGVNSFIGFIYHIIETTSQSMLLFFAFNALIMLIVTVVCLLKKCKIGYKTKTYYKYLLISFILGLICLI